MFIFPVCSPDVIQSLGAVGVRSLSVCMLPVVLPWHQAALLKPVSTFAHFRPSSPLASQAPNHLLKSGLLETDRGSAFLSYSSQTSDGASKGAYEGGQVAGGEAQAEHF